MADDSKAVGPRATAKLVALIKAETAKKYDKTGGKIDGNAEITGGLKVGMSSEFSSSIKAGSEISSDMLLMAPIVELRDPAKEESIYFGVSGESAAKVTSPVSGGGTQYARLAVGTPTGDNDATTKAYVDGSAVRYDAAQALDEAQKNQARENVGAASAFAPILTSPVMIRKWGETESAGVYLSTVGIGEKHAEIRLEDVNENSPVAIANLRTPTDAQTDYATNVAYVKAKVAEVAASGGVDVDNALSATSTNPVQNKVITSALAKKAGTAVATESANGLMSAADKKKLDGIADGANKTVVDAALDAGSANPVQNKAVKAALDNKADKTALDAKADKTALNAKLDKTGGTLTGNLTGKYITGTWLQSTAASDLGRTPDKIAVLDGSGWVYYRTPAELVADLGIANAIKSYVDTAIAVAINSAY